MKNSVSKSCETSQLLDTRKMFINTHLLQVFKFQLIVNNGIYTYALKTARLGAHESFCTQEGGRKLQGANTKLYKKERGKQKVVYTLFFQMPFKQSTTSARKLLAMEFINYEMLFEHSKSFLGHIGWLCRRIVFNMQTHNYNACATLVAVFAVVGGKENWDYHHCQKNCVNLQPGKTLKHNRLICTRPVISRFTSSILLWQSCARKVTFLFYFLKCIQICLYRYSCERERS